MASINDLKKQVVPGVYNGTYTVEKLPKPLYEATAEVLTEAVSKGYDNSDESMLEDLEDNVQMFSAAKTFQQINELSDSLIDDDGNLLSLIAYTALADSIFDRYNEDWLGTEEDTAEWAAKSASDWVDFEKDDNPYLMYVAEIDDHTCYICEPLDGILIDRNDSFWDDNATPQHFDCRCTVETVEGVEVSEPSIGTEAIVNAVKRKLKVSTQQEINNAVAKSHEHKNPMFNYNPGKMRVIFKDKGKDKHPYFIVPAKFKELALRNFDLPIKKLHGTK